MDPVTTIETLSGLRALVVGLGREGLALATYLAGHGFAVTATDAQPAEKLAEAIEPLRQAAVSLALGGHPLTLLDEVDILFVSPGIPLESPFLQAAQERGLPLSSETRLVCHLCPALVVGITGSNGKSTTTTLVGKMLEAAGYKTWVGGNIGRPLIESVDQVGPDDRAVLELSSFQLEYFHGQLNDGVDLNAIAGDDATATALTSLLDSWSPPVSAILNITPNHLDRHPSMKDYVRAKRAIINYQRASGRIIMSLDNDMTRTIGNQFGPRTRWFSLEAQMKGGACLRGEDLVLIDPDGSQHHLAQRREVKLRGRHNLSNILAASLLAREAGASLDAMHQVITTFTGVEHRLELVRELNGVRYYNDSIATSPERLAAALRSFSEPLVLLAGGRDKHLPWEDAARLILHKAHTAILFGEAAAIIEQAITDIRPEISDAITQTEQCATLEEAVARAAQVAQAGDVVLLSPGGTSFDAFPNFAERGDRFRELVEAL